MNRNVLFGIALFVIVSMCYASYSTADSQQLIYAIQTLSSNISTLNKRVKTLNSRIDRLNRRIGTWATFGTLTSEIDELGDDITSLESAIRDQR